MTESALGPKQLIVLGNGFDLECGLKSSYKDFFEQHFAEIILRTISVEQRTNIVNANFPEQSNSSPLRKCPKPAKILYF